jgi:hypothetical protein
VKLTPRANQNATETAFYNDEVVFAFYPAQALTRFKSQTNPILFFGEKLENWKIIALIGAIVFLASAFLPLLAAGSFGISLADFYSLIGWVLGQSEASPAISSGPINLPVEATVAVIGILLTVILYPITVILGFVSFLKRKVALVAGILGIICWVGTIMFIAAIQSMMGMFAGPLGYGAGIFVGTAGAIILLVASFLKIGGTSQQAAIQPTTASTTIT